MHKLYTRPGSGGFVIEAALKLAGVAFEQIDVPKTPEPDPEFLKISPMHQVPVLVLPDGHAVPETAAISLLLAELHPGRGLGPVAGEPGRADFLRWIGCTKIQGYYYCKPIPYEEIAERYRKGIQIGYEDAGKNE